ncbi:hypothetical protein SAZ11_48720 [Streptomyces sp. FXJ1.4098]|nr:hypothetical protein [Streptomyces sp. FXJ1.4098]
MLGVTAQESNMWQAARSVVPGVTGNSLIGNYYGIKYSASGDQKDPWAINFAEADCGYGVTQVTDGMRVHGKEKEDEKPKTTVQQEAVALDYAANIAAGVNILADKWNDTRDDGLIINGGDPKYIENWLYALWAYNAGYHPQSTAGSNSGRWGVGWTNNPANPLWKENRSPFLETGARMTTRTPHIRRTGRTRRRSSAGPHARSPRCSLPVTSSPATERPGGTRTSHAPAPSRRSGSSATSRTTATSSRSTKVRPMTLARDRACCLVTRTPKTRCT